MKWLHNILKGASLTGALFVFQACYGIPQPALWEDGGTAPMSFSLVSRATGLPLEGIGLVLAVEQLCDMPRTCINTYGDSCGAVIIAHSEGEELTI